MSNGMTFLTIFVLAVFVGFEVISKVSSVLHTPLMSGANAIHGVILVGAIIVAGRSDGFALVLALLAVLLATVNMVGGFVVTDRMLEMFGRGRRPRNALPDVPQNDGNGSSRTRNAAKQVPESGRESDSGRKPRNTSSDSPASQDGADAAGSSDGTS
jgi:NAD(P) transhydrogenase subunit alpha